MNRRLSAPCLLLSFAALACSKSSGTEAPVPSASVAAAPSSAPSAVASAPAPAPSASGYDKNHERGPGRGGIDSMLFRAVRDLTLGDATKAKIDALGDQMHDRDTAPRDAMKTFATDLAAQVRAGKIDATKLQPDEAALDDAMKTMLAKQARALGGLHDALDAGQRKALADAVTANMAKREADMKAREADGGSGAWLAKKLDRLTSDLGLDAGQQKQVGALLAKQPAPSAMRDDLKKQLGAVLTAFQADAFDATKALQPTVKGPHDAMDRQIVLTTQLLAVLRPEQRETLARSTMRSAGRSNQGETWSEDDDGRAGGGGNGGGGGGGGGD